MRTIYELMHDLRMMSSELNERSHDNVPSCPNYYTGSLYSVNPFSAVLSSRRTLTQFSQQGVWKRGSLARETSRLVYLVCAFSYIAFVVRCVCVCVVAVA